MLIHMYLYTHDLDAYTPICLYAYIRMYLQTSLKASGPLGNLVESLTRRLNFGRLRFDSLFEGYVWFRATISTTLAAP